MYLRRSNNRISVSWVQRQGTTGEIFIGRIQWLKHQSRSAQICLNLWESVSGYMRQQTNYNCSVFDWKETVTTTYRLESMQSMTVNVVAKAPEGGMVHVLHAIQTNMFIWHDIAVWGKVDYMWFLLESIMVNTLTVDKWQVTEDRLLFFLFIYIYI